MRSVSVMVLACGALIATLTPLLAKTQEECAAEFTANKAKIEGTQTAASFIAACQQGKEPIAGATSVGRPAVPPATAAQQPATPSAAAGEVNKAPAQP